VPDGYIHSGATWTVCCRNPGWTDQQDIGSFAVASVGVVVVVVVVGSPWLGRHTAEAQVGGGAVRCVLAPGGAAVSVTVRLTKTNNTFTSLSPMGVKLVLYISIPSHLFPIHHIM